MNFVNFTYLAYHFLCINVNTIYKRLNSTDYICHEREYSKIKVKKEVIEYENFVN